MRPLDFSIDLILPASTTALRSNQPLTEMSTRNLSCGVKRRQEPKADIITAMSDPIAWNMCEPQSLTTLWASTALHKDNVFEDRIVWKRRRIISGMFFVVGISVLHLYPF
jgi:hypothetical protein